MNQPSRDLDERISSREGLWASSRTANKSHGPQAEDPVHETWIGIPPMHHEEGLSFGPPRRPLVRGPSGRRHHTSTTDPVANFHDSSDYDKGDGMKSCALQKLDIPQWGSDPYEQKWKTMPPHLLPFVPYIEKEVDSSLEAMNWVKGDAIRKDTIRDWLTACQKLHGSRCGEPARRESGPWNGPLWLIDVGDYRLMPAPSDALYVALSYVWGEGAAVQACTTKENLEKFRERRGLCNIAITLPRVITDAIDLVRTIGERFLWVDRFCIIQDDGVAKQCQLNAMGTIYAGALFTLVAAQNEDASEGLYGYRQLDVHDFGSALMTSASASGKDILLDQAMNLMRSKWYSRGWTFQEYLMSRRRVVLHNDTINFECLCASWHELQGLRTVKQPPIPEPQVGCLCRTTTLTGFEFEARPWPDMFRYARLVSMFNRRNLTFSEDVFDAFSGILSHLSRTFPAGFLSGLPQMCFDAALLWQPWTEMTRRNSKRRPASEAVLPSWSWGGWSGNMNSESWRSAANYLLETDDEENTDQQCSWKTISTVKWTYSTSIGSARKVVKISPAFAHPAYDPKSQTLSLGWSVQSDSKNHSQTLYYHSCDPSQPFRYPIPIRDQHIAHTPPVNARYLHGTTMHAFLFLGATYESNASGCPAVDLRTPDGKWVGVLRLNCKPSERDSLVTMVQSEHEGKIELIAISAGEVENQPIEEKSFDEWNREDCPRRQGLYRFFNVLWIEWDDDVAYRKALGRVERNAWEALAPETIDVTLG